VIYAFQVLCRDKDGTEDTRAISSFISEVEKLYQETKTFPVILVAACNSKNGCTVSCRLCTPTGVISVNHNLCEYIIWKKKKTWNSSFGIAAGYRLDIQGGIPYIGKIFLFSIASRPAPGSTWPPIKSVSGVKWLGHEADHSPPCSAEVKNDGAIPPLPDMSSWHSA
jgi:hypothetical protein